MLPFYQCSDGSDFRHKCHVTFRTYKVVIELFFFIDNISTETLHDIRDGNQTYPNIDKREAHLKIRDRIKKNK